MSKLGEPRITIHQAQDDFRRILREYLVLIAGQVNTLSEGRITALYNAAASQPTTGTYKQGDFVPNSAPTELGSVGSKYTIAGWRCIVSGTPGTFVESRELTGN